MDASPPSASKSVLVTGGSAGIGAAAVAYLAARGFSVVATSRTPPRRPLPAGARWEPMDVCDEDAVRRVVAAAGPLDAVVCNAGFGIFGAVEEVTLARARAQFETNVFGVLALARATLAALRARQGRFVVVGSLAGRAPIPFQAHYSATKAAVDALVQALRIEVAAFGVGVSLVEPGDIKTEFNDATDWGEQGGSAYGARLAACEGVVRRSLDHAPGPEVVARAIHRALTDASPRVRYPVGPASWLVPAARRLLPERLSQKLLAAHFGL